MSEANSVGEHEKHVGPRHETPRDPVVPHHDTPTAMKLLLGSRVRGIDAPPEHRRPEGCLDPLGIYNIGLLSLVFKTQEACLRRRQMYSSPRCLAPPAAVDAPRRVRGVRRLKARQGHLL